MVQRARQKAAFRNPNLKVGVWVLGTSGLLGPSSGKDTLRTLGPLLYLLLKVFFGVLQLT